MCVTVQFFAGLRKKAGQNSVSIDISKLGSANGTLSEYLEFLEKEFPSLRGVILDGDSLKPHFVININGHAVADLEVRVNKNDIIAIFPPIAGG